jgi:hypothetical protein
LGTTVSLAGGGVTCTGRLTDVTLMVECTVSPLTVSTSVTRRTTCSASIHALNRMSPDTSFSSGSICLRSAGVSDPSAAERVKLPRCR